MKLLRKLSAIISIVFLGLTQVQACPVCFQSGGEERWAFYVTTAFLTTLPLAVVGLAVYTLYKRSQKLHAEDGE